MKFCYYQVSWARGYHKHQGRASICYALMWKVVDYKIQTGERDEPRQQPKMPECRPNGGSHLGTPEEQAPRAIQRR